MKMAASKIVLRVPSEYCPVSCESATLTNSGPDVEELSEEATLRNSRPSITDEGQSGVHVALKDRGDVPEE